MIDIPIAPKETSRVMILEIYYDVYTYLIKSGRFSRD